MTGGGCGTEGALLSREDPVDAVSQFRCRLQCWSETCPSGFTSAVRARSLRVGFATIWISDTGGLPSPGNLGVVDDPTRFDSGDQRMPSEKNFGRCLTNA